MKVLVVGSGGREHALVWKLAASPQVDEVIVAPGNPGTASVEKARNVAGVATTDPRAVAGLAADEAVGLVVIGPEAPLAAGVGDAIRRRGIPCFGPDHDGAQLEASKIWAKELMRKHGIPTAGFKVFDNHARAYQYLEDGPCPVVIKADGLAAGKGVIIVRDREQGMSALQRIMVDREFGESGQKVLIEDCMSGTECSVLALTDGRTLLTLPTAQDHKAVYDGDKGPNTGGMGAFSPGGAVDDATLATIETRVLVPCLHGLRTDEIDYRGVIYAGLMMTAGGMRVLEFNCRFGDPETQPILVRLKSDLLPVLLAAARGTLQDLPDDAIVVDDRPAVCVVMCSGGYPGAYEKGHEVTGIEQADAMDDVVVFQAGTTRDEDGRLVTSGGRVLGVTALGDTLERARERAYAACGMIRFTNAHYRRDIAAARA